MRRIGLLTSGGDAPGMNACIRAIVRRARAARLEVLGFQRGYRGILERSYVELDSRSVGNIIQRGGTILRTARCEAFNDESGLRSAADILEELKLDGLIVVGGDGSLRGAEELSQHWSGCIIGAPGTIDNDLSGTDSTIGFDTAINTALEAIDKIRDTADAHERFFLVEVMGRRSGFIGLAVGLGGGAEEILLPDATVDLSAICERLCEGQRKGKTSCIIVVAEGAYQGGAFAVAEQLKKLSGNEYRVCVLGHVQRGGSPTAADRLLATKLGAFAVQAELEGETRKMVGEVHGDLVLTPLRETWERKKSLPSFERQLVMVLAR